MSRTPSVRRLAVVAALCAAALALTGLTAAAPSAERVAAHPCQDASLPVADRVDGPPARMTLDDELGRMTGIEKDAPVPQSPWAFP
jgi:beta-glucosidase